ncbi:hypothetical protein ACFQS1_31510 [Paractinoplanes rhizophilus]|uniref:Nuclear transport factor 2 family protein n=1 Tax=Paractinoplanes rhizophilus TaxID=1416877 RepID=A0ABW2HZD4_9ACTN
MQPQEPMPGAAPAPRPAAPSGRKTPNRRMRLILAMMAGLVGLLCLGGVGVAVSLYDEATKIDRASPDQVTSSFLRAYLLDRDDQEASLYTCKSGAELGQIAVLRNDMVGREKKFGTTVTASWESLTITGSTVSVDLVIAGLLNGQQISSHSESWSFGLVDEDGWRVCSASKLS